VPKRTPQAKHRGIGVGRDKVLAGLIEEMSLPQSHIPTIPPVTARSHKAQNKNSVQALFDGLGPHRGEASSASRELTLTRRAIRRQKESSLLCDSVGRIFF
jgi:hypothetical protein